MPSLPRFARAEPRIIAASLVAYSLLFAVSPASGVAAALLLLAISTILTVARLICLGAGAPIPRRCPNPGTPFISIHLATYAEPPELVIKTLDTLRRLDYPDYEVLVIDNNTTLPSLYEPVRQHCARLGCRFRFFHFDGVSGAKAGALNLALGLCDDRTETILVLDADYCASRGLLREGVSYFSEPEIALVQFPQAYRNVSTSCGLTWEYQHFFNVYMHAANRAGTVLSTGTVSFLRKAALLRIGGWPCETLTEDAELGLRLQQWNLRAVYVAQVVSRGLMPTDLKSLHSQRRRWVLGNAQSLRGVLGSARATLMGKVMMLLQLTAWWNPLLPCGVMLLVGMALNRFSPHGYAALVIAASVTATAIYLAGACLFFVLAATRHGGTRMAGIKSFLVHLGLFWPGALSWAELLVKGDRRFIRTDKSVAASGASGARTALVASVVAAVAGCGVALEDPALGFCGLVSGLLLLGRGTLLWTLGQVRSRTLELIQSERRSGAEVHAGPLQSAGRASRRWPLSHQDFDHHSVGLLQSRDGHGVLFPSQSQTDLAPAKAKVLEL